MTTAPRDPARGPPIPGGLGPRTNDIEKGDPSLDRRPDDLDQN
ncbi:MAG: hypothetical protein WBZ00_03445 [Solirubrobacterales bacterium]